MQKNLNARLERLEETARRQAAAADPHGGLHIVPLDELQADMGPGVWLPEKDLPGMAIVQDGRLSVVVRGIGYDDI